MNDDAVRYTLFLGDIPVRHFGTLQGAAAMARRLPLGSRREAQIIKRDRAYPFKPRGQYYVDRNGELL